MNIKLPTVIIPYMNYVKKQLALAVFLFVMMNCINPFHFGYWKTEVKTQIKCCIRQHIIRVCTVC